MTDEAEMIFPKVIAGDFEGSAEIQIGGLWSGAKARTFKGLKMQPNSEYAPADLKRLIQYSDDTRVPELATTKAASADQGPRTANYGVELVDGKRFIMSQSPNDKLLLCMIAYAKERGIYERDLSF